MVHLADPDAALPHTSPARAEADLRRYLDRAIGRALFDKAYERDLLADPTVALGGLGVAPQQYLALRGLRARSLTELARLAHQEFWPVVNGGATSVLPVTAAAAR